MNADRTLLRRPLGLVLPGGGALGAWQAGAMAELAEAGIVFDKIIGFSAGALSGTGYFLDRVEELLDRWANVDRERILRFSPKLQPFSLFSGDSILESIAYTRDEERARQKARCELTIIAHAVEERASHYFRFTPGGERGWDGPLMDRLAASCAIPFIFPPVTVAGKVYRDGVVPGEAPMRFDSLEGCADVLTLELIRPEEGGLRFWNPWSDYEQKGRDASLMHMTDGLASLARLPHPPRVHRLQPSRVLDYSMLSFASRHCAPAIWQGREDARAFLKNLPLGAVS